MEQACVLLAYSYAFASIGIYVQMHPLWKVDIEEGGEHQRWIGT